MNRHWVARRYRAFIRAGKPNDAFALYQDFDLDLSRDLSRNQFVVDLLALLFPNGIDQLPALTNPRDQDHCLSEFATALEGLGCIDDTLVVQQQAFRLAMAEHDAQTLGIRLVIYGNTLTASNRLAAARPIFELACDLADGTRNDNQVLAAWLHLFSLYVDTGQWGVADAAWNTFCLHLPEHSASFLQPCADQYRGRMRHFQGRDATRALVGALEDADEIHDSHTMRAVCRWLGDIALQNGDPDRAANYFTRAVELARLHRSSELAYHLGRLALARMHQNQPKAARALLADAFAQPFRAEEHDLHHSAAEVYLTLGEHDKATEHAITAYKIAWADGPPHSWWWGLERAKKTLAALGVDPPDMPPFDPANVEPIPYEDAIRVWIEELRAKNAGDD